MEVYQHIAATVGVPATPTGFVQFQEAIIEVTVAKMMHAQQLINQK